MKITGGMKRLIIDVIVIVLFLGVVGLFPGLRFRISRFIFEGLPYSMSEKLIMRTSKSQLVGIAEDFYKRLDIPFPKIDDFDKEVVASDPKYLLHLIRTGKFPTAKIYIESSFSDTRGYLIARLWLKKNSECIAIDPQTKEVIYYKNYKKKHIENKSIEEPITQKEASRLANRYLDIIGRPPDAGDARLCSPPYEQKNDSIDLWYYTFYFPKILNGYEYDPTYSGIWISIEKSSGRLVEYKKHFWGQKRTSITLNINKNEATKIVKTYHWEKLKKKLNKEGLKIVEPLETGEPQLFIVSPNYWPIRWKTILFETNLKGRLVWKVPVKFLRRRGKYFPFNRPEYVNIFVDAKDGNVVGKPKTDSYRNFNIKSGV
jgi:hypothetical protein